MPCLWSREESKKNIKNSVARYGGTWLLLLRGIPEVNKTKSEPAIRRQSCWTRAQLRGSALLIPIPQGFCRFPTHFLPTLIFPSSLA